MRVRWLSLWLLVSVGLGACGANADAEGDAAPASTGPPAVIEQSTTTSGTAGTGPMADAPRPDVVGWLDRYDLAVPTGVQYPVITTAPDLAPGTLSIGGREIVVDEGTRYVDNCPIILRTVRTAPERGPFDSSLGCYLLVRLDDRGAADWITSIWSSGDWAKDADGRWTPLEPDDAPVVVGRLLDMGGGDFVVETGIGTITLAGAIAPQLGPDCPSIADPEFFTMPELFVSAVIDPVSGTVTGVRCEYQYFD